MDKGIPDFSHLSKLTKSPLEGTTLDNIQKAMKRVTRPSIQARSAIEQMTRYTNPVQKMLNSVKNPLQDVIDQQNRLVSNNMLAQQSVIDSMRPITESPAQQIQRTMHEIDKSREL